MSGYDDEQHRDDVDSAAPVTPKQLGHTVSVRLDPDLAQRCYDYAARLGWSLPDVLRHAATSMLGQPIGWRCEHFHVTGAPGGIGPTSAGCGCVMAPVYRLSELAA